MNAPGENSGQKGKYQQELDNILSTGLTAENINTYSDDAIDRLADLIDEIKNDSAYKWDFSLNASSKEQEDEMFNQILGIDVSSALDGIAKIGEDIGHLESIIQKQRQNNQDQTVYIPADRLGYTAMVASNGDFTKSPIVPKTKVALFILENDFGVNLDNEDEFQISTGINTESMMRQVSYDIINLPLLNRAIASCDEIGNRTFVFDTGLLAERGFSLDDIKNMTKQEIQDLLAKDTELGASLFYSKNYPAHLAKLIKEPKNTLAKQIEDNPDQFGQKKQYLKEAANAPEGWVTVSNYVGKHGGIDIKTLRKLISDSNLEAKDFKVQNHGVYPHYKEDDLKKIVGPRLNAEMAPEGWVTIKSFAKSRGGISRTTLGNLVLKSNIESKEYKTDMGKLYSHYKKDDLEKIYKAFLDSKKTPEGWVTIQSFADSHEGISFATLNKLIQKNNIESRELRVEQGRKAQHYREKDLEKLASSLLNSEKAPEGWVTIRSFADSHKGIGPATLAKLARKSNIESREFRIEHGNRYQHYKKEDLEKLASPLLNSEKAPEGWVTLLGFIEKHGEISHKQLTKLIKDNNIESREFKIEGGARFQHYREEDLKKIADPLLNTEWAPEGWITIKGFVDDHKGIGYESLAELVQKNNIESREYRVERGMRHKHYKEEDLQRIISEDSMKKD